MSHILNLEKAVRQLGPAIEEYRADPVRIQSRQIAGSWMALTGVLLIASAGLLGVATLGGLSGVALMVSLLLGMVLLLAGLWLVAISRQEKHSRFLVLERGLAFEQPNQIKCIRWDALSTVRMKSWQRWGTRTFCCYLQLKNGDRIKFAKNTLEFPGIAHLCDRIQVELTSRQLTPALEAFEEGETLHFGPIEVSRAGITNQGDCIPWEAIQDIQLQNGCIVILQSPNPVIWSDATPDTVPNIFVLLTLVQQIFPRQQVRHL